MKRTTVLIAALSSSLALTLTACGTDDDTTAAGDQGAADCEPAHDFSTVEDGVLTVGVISSLPYTSINPVTQKWEGIEAEIADAIAAKECLTVKAVTVGGADAIQSLSSGQLDLLSAGAYITPERGEVVGQTDPLYYQYTVAISNTGVSSVADLQGKTVGALAGSAYVDPVRAVIGADNLREYPSTSDLLADVDAGRVDVALAASGEASYQLAQAGFDLQVETLDVDGLEGVEPSYGVDMPYTPSNSALGSALNDDIAELRQDGTIKSVLGNWNLDDDATLNGSE